MENRTYIAIDLKSFYASVECMERGLDPMTANLVVADASRTEKTICLAVSPALKAWGISGRARLFEVVQKVKDVNRQRRRKAPGGQFSGKSCDDIQLKSDPSLELDYIIAPPRMAKYMEVSTEIYQVYMKYVAPEDIQVYSIDEVLIDITSYLSASGLTAHQYAMRMIRDVLKTTGITATAGIGTNLYLAKIAMDIVAKHAEPDSDGVRIAELDEMSYRRRLWDHRPITDFWRVGRGYARKLETIGISTMGDVARQSVRDEEILYSLFGVNAELLIDHAWGWEPCTMKDIKAYKPETNSINSGQVLQYPYPYEKAELVVREMAELLALDLVEKGLVTDQIVLTIGYDVQNLKDSKIRKKYKGEITTDRYGRKLPKHAHGTGNIGRSTSSGRLITEAAMEIFHRTVNKDLLVRRVTIVANHVIRESEAVSQPECEQLDFFTDYEALKKQNEAEDAELEQEKRRQEAIINIKKKFGKNAILKGMNLEEGATTVERNGHVGGHKA